MNPVPIFQLFELRGKKHILGAFYRINLPTIVGKVKTAFYIC
jgi:hypothetical protein